MPFAFQPGEPYAEAVQRIAREECEAALDHLRGEDVSQESVHAVRKHMKKMRGLVRLVRKPLGKSYRRANVLCRDTARCLSGVRDADVMLETLAWVAGSGRPIDSGLLRDCKTVLQQHRDAVRRSEGDIQDKVEQARCYLRELAGEIEDWHLPDRQRGLIKNGLGRLYRQSRRRYRLSMAQPSETHFHDWRKRVKYHWYHCRLLEPLAPDYLQTRTMRLKALSDIIGTEHDLAVLRAFLSNDAGSRVSQIETLDMLEVIVSLQGQQREQAWHLGGELFAQPGDYWRRQCLQALEAAQ